MPTLAWHPSACHKEEAVCCAQVVQASRQQVTPKASFGSLQSPRMAVAQKQRMKNF
ncbi:MAG: hypothetical protein ING88_19205 [Cytophagales bacterium]|jgi:hypothetical protein|nr:hypothetical protein [Cytophagales bacterium]